MYFYYSVRGSLAKKRYTRTLQLFFSVFFRSIYRGGIGGEEKPSVHFFIFLFSDNFLPNFSKFYLFFVGYKENLCKKYLVSIKHEHVGIVHNYTY